MVIDKVNLLAESKITYGDGGVLAEYAWILVVLPFISALLITFTGKNYLTKEQKLL